MFTDGEHWLDQRKFTMRHLREFGLNKKGMETLIHKEVEDLFDKVISEKEKHNVCGISDPFFQNLNPI